MKRKMVLLVIGLVFAMGLGFSLFQASKLQSIQIEKEILINGDLKEVFGMVQYLNNFPKWSPFFAQDPSQKVEVKGIDGTVGARYHWEGNGGKDLGFQEIVKIDSFSLIEMKCDIQKPFVAKPSFVYTFLETPSGVKVTQVFSLQSGLVDAFFLWLFNAKTAMGETNQMGMELLKKAVEK